MNAKVKVKKKPGRKRRTAGWTLLILGTLVAAAWVWSGFGYYSNAPIAGFSVWCGGGLFEFSHESPNRIPHEFETMMAGFGDVDDGPRWTLWSWRLGRDESPQLVFAVGAAGPVPSGLTTVIYRVAAPVWMLSLLLWVPAALLLRSGIRAHRRAMANACPTCGYSLAGIVSGTPCPECGKAAEINAKAI